MTTRTEKQELAAAANQQFRGDWKVGNRALLDTEDGNILPVTITKVNLFGCIATDDSGVEWVAGNHVLTRLS